MGSTTKTILKLLGEESMNKYTHKTVRVNATIENDLYMDINVPIGIKDDDICQIIWDGILDGVVTIGCGKSMTTTQRSTRTHPTSRKKC